MSTLAGRVSRDESHTDKKGVDSIKNKPTKSMVLYNLHIRVLDTFTRAKHSPPAIEVQENNDFRESLSQNCNLFGHSNHYLQHILA